MSDPHFLEQLEGAYPFTPATDEMLFDGTSYTMVLVKSELWDSSTGILRPCVEILNWFRQNPVKWDERVLHEPEGGSMHVKANPINAYHRDGFEWNRRHRFYFSNAQFAAKFAAVVDELIGVSGTPLIPEFDTVDCPNDGILLAGMIPYSFSSDPFDPELISLWFWCQDNITGKVYNHEDEYLIFEKIEDLILYKLALTGDETVALPEIPIQ